MKRKKITAILMTALVSVGTVLGTPVAQNIYGSELENTETDQSVEAGTEDISESADTGSEEIEVSDDTSDSEENADTETADQPETAEDEETPAEDVSEDSVAGEDADTEIFSAEEDSDSEVSVVEMQEPQMVAHFSFDDAENGLAGEGAKAVNTTGTALSFGEGCNGQALSVSSASPVCLDVVKEDGSPLLSNADGVTVSYYSKMTGSGEVQTFYAAQNAEKMSSYLGCEENADTVRMETGSGADDTIEFANTFEQNTESAQWNHIVAVYSTDACSLYVNGNLTDTQPLAQPLGEILGETGGVVRIGDEQNENTESEYECLLDEYSIYNYAMTAEEVAALPAVQDEESTTPVTATRTIYFDNVLSRMDDKEDTDKIWYEYETPAAENQENGNTNEESGQDATDAVGDGNDGGTWSGWTAMTRVQKDDVGGGQKIQIMSALKVSGKPKCLRML